MIRFTRLLSVPLIALLAAPAWAESEDCVAFRESRPEVERVGEFYEHYGSATAGILGAVVGAGAGVASGLRSGYMTELALRAVAVERQAAIPAAHAAMDAWLAELRGAAAGRSFRARALRDALALQDFWEANRILFEERFALTTGSASSLGLSLAEVDAAITSTAATEAAVLRFTSTTERIVALTRAGMATGRATILRAILGASVGGLTGWLVVDNFIFPSSAGDEREASSIFIEEDPSLLYAFRDSVACDYIDTYAGVRGAFRRMIEEIRAQGRAVAEATARISEYQNAHGSPEDFEGGPVLEVSPELERALAGTAL